MKYRKVSKKDPRNPGGAPKWYANPVNSGRMGIKEFSKEISGRSSLTAGDVANVLSNFVEELPVFLMLGMSIKLGEFGTLRLTISSKGADSPEEFTVANINGVRVVFTPGVDLKKALENIHFEEE
jgi:predicted histone-like DNA-binding protein